MSVSDDARPVDGDDPSSLTPYNPLVPKLVIELEGERGEFLAFAQPNQWALMQNAEAARNRADNSAGMAAMYRLAVTSVKPGDRDRFEAFMGDHGQDQDLIEKIGDALNQLWSGETMLPLAPTSSGSSDSAGESGSTSEGDSSSPDTAPLPDFDPAVERVAPGEHLMTPEPADWDMHHLTATSGSSSPDSR